MNLLGNSFQMLRGERRGSSLYLWWISLAAAVAILFWFLALSQRVELFLQRSTSGFLAADIVLSSPHQIREGWIEEAADKGIQRTTMVRFSTMLFALEKLQLSSVKAVADGYPLRGELRVASVAGSSGEWIKHGPDRGTIWLTETLALQLGVAPGALIELGDIELRFTHFLLEQPDVAFGLFSSSPVSMMHIDDLDASGVVRPGSRVSYRYLFSGSSEAVDAWYEWLKQHKGERHRVTSLLDRESNLGDAYQRSQQVLFLALASALALTLIAMWSALQSYATPLTRRVGILRILGASKGRLLAQFALHLGLTMLAGIACGLIVGSILDRVAANEMAEFAPLLAEQSVGITPYLFAVLSGVLASLCLLTPLFIYLFKAPPRALLESAERSAKKPPLVAGILLALGFILLTGLVSGWLNLFLMGGLILLLILLCSLMLWGLQHLRLPDRLHRLKLPLLLLIRQRVRVTIQMVGLTLAISLALAMVFIRVDLINEWQRLVPEQSANFFFVNVSPEERDDLTSAVSAHEGVLSGFYPIIRGRMTAINGEVVVDDRNENTEQDPDRRRGIDRELNLTWSEVLPEGNIIEEGEWHSTVKGDGLSVEQGMADRLDLRLGDELTFALSGAEVTLPITSIRSLDWQSMRPNFFVIFPKQSLEPFAHTYIASFYLPYQHRDWLFGFMREYPAVTLIDIEQVLSKFAGYLAQILRVVTVLVVLVLLTALLVTASLVMGSFVRRQRELHIYRILGAADNALRGMLLTEFVMVGLLAGTIAALIGETLLAAQSQWVFQQLPSWHPTIWLMGPLIGVCATLPLAIWLTHRLLSASRSSQSVIQ